jgi:hypothetical protein
MPLRVLLCALAAAVVVAIFAGCGSSTVAGTSADPAGAVPASAALYAGAVLRPQGSLGKEALAAGKALTHQADPYVRLLLALQTPGSPTLEYKRDVAPWLGENGGVYLASAAGASTVTSLLEQGLLGIGSASASFPFGASGAQGAIVLDTSDVSKAQSFLNGQAAHAGAHAASYRGTSYRLSSSGVAFGIVDRFAVIGSEAGIHAVIDTTLGGSPLARAGGYAKLLAAAPKGAIAHVFSAAAPASAKAAAAPTGVAGVLAAMSSGEEANISLVASSGSLALDADTLGTGSAAPAGAILAADPQSAKALEELPGESWLAIGLGHVGSRLSEDVAGLRALVSLTNTSGATGVEAPTTSPFSLKSLLEGLLTPLSVLGADTPLAKRDFASWMGSAGVFASGGSLLELKGGVKIESNNATQSKAAVSELGAQLRKLGAIVQPASIAGTEAALGARITGLPVILDIAAGRSASGKAEFVLGLGEASVAAALNPSSTMASASSRSSAASALGEGTGPSIVADFPTFLTLLEGVGLTEDPTLSKFLPYLRAATTLAGGGHELGGSIDRFRLVLGLQQEAG